MIHRDAAEIRDALQQAFDTRVQKGEVSNLQKKEFLLFWLPGFGRVEVVLDGYGTRPYLHFIPPKGLRHTKVVDKLDYLGAAKALKHSYEQWNVDYSAAATK